MVFQQAALATGEAAAAVRPRAMPLQPAASAAQELPRPVALGFPSAEALGRFFAAGRRQARPERAIFFR
jgi:hypothetical protein